MPQQRLPFVGQHRGARAPSPTDSDALSNLQSNQFAEQEAELRRSRSPRPLQPPTNRRRTQNPKKKLRTSWIYDHIPDDDRSTIYLDKEGRQE